VATVPPEPGWCPGRDVQAKGLVLQDVGVTIAEPAALDAETEHRIRESIGRQTLLTTLGISVAGLTSGRVALDLPFRADLCQQHGYVHAGAITALADSACGYAAASLMPADRDVLTVEFKVNLLTPARGDRFRATGAVIRAGRTLTVCSAEVVAWADDSDGKPAAPLVTVALMQATMMAVTTPAPGR
jgi:uncharacterized protein (TIGR00369 family)